MPFFTCPFCGSPGLAYSEHERLDWDTDEEGYMMGKGRVTLSWFYCNDESCRGHDGIIFRAPFELGRVEAFDRHGIAIRE